MTMCQSLADVLPKGRWFFLRWWWWWWWCDPPGLLDQWTTPLAAKEPVKKGGKFKHLVHFKVLWPFDVPEIELASFNKNCKVESCNTPPLICLYKCSDLTRLMTHLPCGKTNIAIIDYPWLSPFIDYLPTKKMVIFHSYVSLPEGNSIQVTLQ